MFKTWKGVIGFWVLTIGAWACFVAGVLLFLDQKISSYSKELSQIEETQDRKEIVQSVPSPDGKNVNTETPFPQPSENKKEIKPKKEILETFYPSGVKKSEITLFEGKKNGECRFFYEDGSLESEGQYIDGVKSGLWTFYHKNGRVREAGSYISDQKNGNWEVYYNDGTRKADIAYVNGRREGRYLMYHPNGEKRLKGDYKDGKKIGLWRYWSDKDFSQYIHYVDGKIKFLEQTNSNGIRTDLVTFDENEKRTIWYKKHKEIKD